jgi:hypothetical protein
MLNYLKDKGILYVPNLNKSFNKQGEEIKWKQLKSLKTILVQKKLNY